MGRIKGKSIRHSNQQVGTIFLLETGPVEGCWLDTVGAGSGMRLGYQAGTGKDGPGAK